MKYLKYLGVAAVLFLPACHSNFNCGGGGDDPGETLKKYETDEHVFFIDESLCVPGAIVAKSRSGSIIDFCEDTDLAKRMVAVPPRVTADVFRYGQSVPVVEIMKSDGATDREIANGEAARENFEMRGRSAYWAALRREEYFLKRYRDGIPYPEPGSKDASDEAWESRKLTVKHLLNL